MLHGFDLRVTRPNPFTDWVSAGTAILESTWPKAARRLDKFLEAGVLDGNAIKTEWFAKTNAHVFVSHSHADKDIAAGLAGFLHEKLGLLAFVDSLIWGDSRDILRRIDKEHCWSEERKVFDYEQRNYSTSHVHMMLATSLTTAIDNCECLMFLNTPSSLNITDADNPRAGAIATASPWIYHELMTSSVVHRHPDSRRSLRETIAMDSLEEAKLKVGYRAPRKHLSMLRVSDLDDWATRGVAGFDALDALYERLEPHSQGLRKLKSFKAFLAEQDPNEK
jgi:hypothetical protein